MRVGLALCIVIAASLASVAARAENASAAYLCSNIRGVVLPAPTWQAESDAMSGQHVFLHFKGDGSRSEVKWYRDGRAYWEPIGLGLRMKAGFAIIVYSDEVVETYMLNRGTSELLFTATRAGSAVLPNLAKAFRGVCRPVGTLVR